MKGIIVYDSWNGSTEKVAKAISSETGFGMFRVDNAPLDLLNYDLLIIGTLNVRKRPSEKIIRYVENVSPPAGFAVFVTFGMPLWGPVSSAICLNFMKKRLENKNSRFLGQFMCPGFHVKYKTYRDRPSEKDFILAKRFGRKLAERDKTRS